MRKYNFVPTRKHHADIPVVEIAKVTKLVVTNKKILCVCDEGNNRSVHLSYALRYLPNDTIPLGLNTSTQETQTMLFKWADIIITTSHAQIIPKEYQEKVQLYPIEDIYPRPFNKELLELIKRTFIERPL